MTASVTREGVAPETYIGRRAGGSAHAIATSRLLTTGISLSLRYLNFLGNIGMLYIKPNKRGMAETNITEIP